MSDDTTDDGLNRRRVLKGVAGGSVAAAAVSGATASTVGAESGERREPALAEYGDLRTARSTIESEAPFPELAARGLLDGGDAGALDLDSFVPPEEFYSGDATGVVTVDVHKTSDDRLTPDVLARYEVDDREVTLHVLPEAGRSYAVVAADGDGDPTIVDPERGETFTACDSQDLFCSDITCWYGVGNIVKQYCCIDNYCFVKDKWCTVC